jgi:hypothetical protein
MAAEKPNLDAEDERMIVLYCETIHKKTLSRAHYLDWKSQHGPGKVLLCQKRNTVLVPEDEIPAPHLKAIKEHIGNDCE